MDNDTDRHLELPTETEASRSYMDILKMFARQANASSAMIAHYPTGLFKPAPAGDMDEVWNDFFDDIKSQKGGSNRMKAFTMLFKWIIPSFNTNTTAAQQNFIRRRVRTQWKRMHVIAQERQNRGEPRARFVNELFVIMQIFAPTALFNSMYEQQVSASSRPSMTDVTSDNFVRVIFGHSLDRKEEEKRRAKAFLGLLKDIGNEMDGSAAWSSVRDDVSDGLNGYAVVATESGGGRTGSETGAATVAAASRAGMLSASPAPLPAPASPPPAPPPSPPPSPSPAASWSAASPARSGASGAAVPGSVTLPPPPPPLPAVPGSVTLLPPPLPAVPGSAVPESAVPGSGASAASTALPLGGPVPGPAVPGSVALPPVPVASVLHIDTTLTTQWGTVAGHIKSLGEGPTRKYKVYIMIGGQVMYDPADYETASDLFAHLNAKYITRIRWTNGVEGDNVKLILAEFFKDTILVEEIKRLREDGPDNDLLVDLYDELC